LYPPRTDLSSYKERVPAPISIDVASAPSEERPSTWRSWAARQSQRGSDPQFQLQLVLFALSLGALMLFAKLAEDYLDREAITRWDVEFSRWLHLHSSAALVSLFKVVTYAGNAAFLAVLALAAVLFLLRRRALNEAVLLCVGVVGIEAVNALLKLAFHRPRPELAYVHLDTYSFPSGHAAGSSAIYAILLYLLARERGWGVRIACALAWLGIVGVVAFSRLYLEVHYLSDVLAGISLGTAWAAACLCVYELKRGSLESRLPQWARVAVNRLARD
jgi:membrane-associated phospholipid phosphatase